MNNKHSDVAFHCKKNLNQKHKNVKKRRMCFMSLFSFSHVFSNVTLDFNSFTVIAVFIAV
jgi:hypothetical protein